MALDMTHTSKVNRKRCSTSVSVEPAMKPSCWCTWKNVEDAKNIFWSQKSLNYCMPTLYEKSFGHFSYRFLLQTPNIIDFTSLVYLESKL